MERQPEPGQPVLIGASRKSFPGALLDAGGPPPPPAARDAATSAVALFPASAESSSVTGIDVVVDGGTKVW